MKQCLALSVKDMSSGNSFVNIARDTPVYGTLNNIVEFNLIDSFRVDSRTSRNIITGIAVNTKITYNGT